MIKDATPSRLAIAAAFAAIAIPTTPVLAQEVATPAETAAPMTPAPTAAPEPATAPAASESVSPLQSNGDGSLLGVWIALAAGAVVAAGGLLLWRRNRRDVEAIQPVAPPATAVAQPAYAAEPVRATEMAAPGLTPRETVAEPVVAAPVARPSYVEPREPVMAQHPASRAVARTSAAHPVVTRGMHATMDREQAAHPVADRIHPAEREKMRVAREAALPFGKGRRVDDSRRTSDYPTGNFVPA